jgi:hypothetical protein
VSAGRERHRRGPEGITISHRHLEELTCKRHRHRCTDGKGLLQILFVSCLLASTFFLQGHRGWRPVLQGRHGAGNCELRLFVRAFGSLPAHFVHISIEKECVRLLKQRVGLPHLENPRQAPTVLMSQERVREWVLELTTCPAASLRTSIHDMCSSTH